MLPEIKNALDLYRTAAEKASAAKAASDAAEKEYCDAIPDDITARRAKDIHALLHGLNEKHKAAYAASERAARIKKAAQEIAERRIESAAAPVVLAVLEKYAGKPAGPKTRDKAAAEIAAALGVKSVYFAAFYSGGDVTECRIHPGAYDYALNPVVRCRYPFRMIDADNKFCVPEELNAPNLDGLPDDLEAWADEFETAAAELEAAKEAFEAAASRARRVNLGSAELPHYRITR